MPNQEELDRLAEDLKSIKNALQRSGNIMRWVNWTMPIRWISLVGGLIIIALAYIVSLLNTLYGSFGAAPGWIKAVFFGGIALAVSAFALWKLRVITRQLKEKGSALTCWQLFEEVYTRLVAVFVIPFLCIVAGMVVFLAVKGLDAYIIPVLAVLMSLVFVFFSMQFHFKELYGSSFWLIVSGFICLFLNDVIGPMGALALTFGGSMVFLFVMTLFPGEAEKQGGPRG